MVPDGDRLETLDVVIRVRWLVGVIVLGVAVGYISFAAAGDNAAPQNSSHRADPGQFRAGNVNEQAIQQALGFTDFPLLWLGESFEGYPLTAFLRQKGERQDAVYLIYGTCEAPARMTEPSCVPPVEIITSAPGIVPSPDKVADHVAGASTMVRGVTSRVLSGSSFLWTGGVTITIDANSEDLDAAIAGLRTANHQALGRSAINPGESLESLAR
jgi:hypothetical protein